MLDTDVDVYVDTVGDMVYTLRNIELVLDTTVLFPTIAKSILTSSFTECGVLMEPEETPNC